MLFIKQIINCLNLLKPIQKYKYLSETQTVKLSANLIVIAITTIGQNINPRIYYKIT